MGPGADTRAAGGVLRGRGSLPAAGAVVDVGAEPHPLVAVARGGPDGLEWPAQRHHRVHRRDDRLGQHQFPAAHPAGPGRPDRAHRTGAGAAGRAGGAHPDRAGTARRGRPSHVADRGPGRDRAVPPQRSARISPRPSSARSAKWHARRWRRCGGCSACCATTSPPGSRRSPSYQTCPRSSMPPGEPGYRSSCPCPRRWTRCLPASRCARTGSCRNRCPTPASTPPEPRSPCRWTMMPARSCCGWPTDPAGPAGPSGNERGPGHGLTGMRERVALLGGSLSAGPAPDGGFVVSAVLPLGEAA